MTLKAIETRYAGCRFRSRLEARWAVFFDSLGIRWEYEPQGFVIGDRLVQEPRCYLPDFWFPGLQLWGEVKGKWTVRELETMCWATLDVTGLPKNPDGDELTDDERNRPRILLLGNFQPHGGIPAWLLNHHKGDVELDRYQFRTPRATYPKTLWNDAGDWWMDPTRVCDILNTDKGANDPACAQALNDARQARFEHGETGTPISVYLRDWLEQNNPRAGQQ